MKGWSGSDKRLDFGFRGEVYTRVRVAADYWVSHLMAFPQVLGADMVAQQIRYTFTFTAHNRMPPIALYCFILYHTYIRKSSVRLYKIQVSFLFIF